VDTERPDGPELPEGAVAWRQLLAEAQRRFEAAGIEMAAGDARRIVEEASGYEGAELVLGLGEPATERGVAAFDRMVERRLAGEPLQYVLGGWSFRSLDLFVDRRVLIPRPETESVVERALAVIDVQAARRRPDPVTVVDLGTGSGAIALSVAFERPATVVWATDRSPDALAVARANLAGIGRAATRVHLAEGSWFQALPQELRGTIDLVISNPPYVAATDELPPEVVEHEPVEALIPGPTGYEALDHLVDEAPTWLRADGTLILEMAPTQTHTIEERARARGFTRTEVGRDLAGRNRFVVATRS
jgi:release factor glutamine methyltransferase